MNDVGAQTQHRNYAQEEKEEEIQKNISNYHNLLEQQLLISPSLTKVAHTPNSNIHMNNLSQAEPEIDELLQKQNSVANKENLGQGGNN